MKWRIILAGETGGMKTRLGLVEAATGLHPPVAEATFQSVSYPGVEVIAREFLTPVAQDVEVACFGVAGLLTGDKARITNLAWDELKGKTWQMADLFTGEMYEGSGDAMCTDGLYADLPPWGCHVLSRWQSLG